MIDHRLGGCRQDVGMVLKKPASAGFLLPPQKRLVDSGIAGHLLPAIRGYSLQAALGRLLTVYDE